MKQTTGGAKLNQAWRFEGCLHYPALWAILISGLTGLGYYLTAKFGFAFTFGPHAISVLWLPNSIVLSALVLTPMRSWWLPLLATFCAHLTIELQSGVPLNLVLCWFVSNSFEAIIGASLTRLLVASPFRFDNLRNISVFFVCGALAGAFLSSFLDAAFVSFNHWRSEDYWLVWRMRFFSNSFASMTLGPVIITWATIRPIIPSRISISRIAEILILTVGLTSTSVAVFYNFDASTDIIPAALYAPLPLFLWATVRFGMRGVATSIFAVALLAIWSATHGRGPFLTSSPEVNALSIQIFFVVLSALLIPLATTLAERKAVTDALRESQQRYREVVESQTDLVCRYLADTSLTFVNEAYCRYFNRQREDLIGRRILDMLPPISHEKVLLGIASLMVHRKPTTWNHEVIFPDGSVGWQQWVGRPIEDADGHIRELQAIGRDITTRIRAETALKESEQQNRAILNAIPDSIFLLNKTGVCLDCYVRDQNQLLLSPDQFRCKHVRDMLPTRIASEVILSIEAILRSGEMKILEYTLPFRGKEHCFETRMVRSGTDRVLCLVRDITEHKQVEEAKQTLMHASRLAVIGELTSMMAHEVNQPLTAILTNSAAGRELLNSSKVPLDEIRHILEDIHRDSVRASEAVRSTRALAQKRPASVQRLEIRELIEESVRLVTADAARCRVQIHVRFATNVPQVEGDPIHLQQVLLNLIINAMEAMTESPEAERFLTVRAEAHSNGDLAIAVKDTGPGIPADLSSRIFQSFFSTKKHGVGIGLSIARSIIEAHGGRIWCENNASGGATFHIVLPRSEPHSKAK
jgi:PAS domain S-box-containing protein